MIKPGLKLSGDLRGMESVVEDVEDEREKEGSPANSQSCEDSGGCELMRMSISVQHRDVLTWCGPHQSHHSQADNWEYLLYHKPENAKKC